MNASLDVFGFLLIQLYECSAVNRVIVVDNTEDQSFRTKIGILAHPVYTDKLTILNGAEHECYVNGAWNLGMNEARQQSTPETPFYAILNDDIILKSNVMEDICRIMETDNGISMLTVETMNNVPIEKYLKKWTNGTEGMTQSIPHGRQGWFMCGKKVDWLPIPEQLKLFYGDDFIYGVARKRGRAVMLIDPVISHYQSSSVNKNMNKLKPIIDADAKAWAEYIKTHK